MTICSFTFKSFFSSGKPCMVCFLFCWIFSSLRYSFFVFLRSFCFSSAGLMYKTALVSEMEDVGSAGCVTCQRTHECDTGWTPASFEISCNRKTNPNLISWENELSRRCQLSLALQGQAFPLATSTASRTRPASLIYPAQNNTNSSKA